MSKRTRKASKKKKSNSPVRIFRARYILPLIYIILFALSYLFPGKLWAFSEIEVMPIWIQIICGVLALSLFSNKILSYIEKLFSAIGNVFFGGSKTKGIVLFAIFSLVFLFVASNDHVFIGDSHFVESMVKNPEQHDQTFYRIPTVYIYRAFNQIAPQIQTWKMISYLHIFLGFVFAMLFYGIIRTLFDKYDESGAFFIMFFAAYPILVFTHIELYAIAFSIVALFWLLLIKWLKGEQRKPYFLAGNFVAIVFHHLSFFLTPLSADAYLIKKKQKKLLLINIIAFFVILIASSAITSLREHFIVFTNIEYLFKPGYWALIINYIFAAAPFVLFAIFAGKNELIELEGSDEKAEFNSNIRAIFGLGALWSVLLLVFLDFKLGGNDWDIAAMISLPIFLFAAFLIAKSPRRGIRAIAIGFSIIYIILHIALGTSYDMQAERQRHLVLGQSTPYYDKEFDPHMKLGVIYGYESDLERSAEAFDELIAKNPYDKKGYLSLATILSREEEYDKALEVLNRAIEYNPRDRALMKKYQLTRVIGKLTDDGILKIDREKTSDRLNKYEVDISEDLIGYMRKIYVEGDSVAIAFLINQYADDRPEMIQIIMENFNKYQNSEQFPDSARFYKTLISFKPAKLGNK
ncbi:MAG: tetratricopeptide repeat protein [Candidatus Zixiibacteriota bacterium]